MVVAYFVINSVRKLLDILLYIYTDTHNLCKQPSFDVLLDFSKVIFHFMKTKTYPKFKYVCFMPVRVNIEKGS